MNLTIFWIIARMQASTRCAPHIRHIHGRHIEYIGFKHTGDCYEQFTLSIETLCTVNRCLDGLNGQLKSYLPENFCSLGITLNVSHIFSPLFSLSNIVKFHQMRMYNIIRIRNRKPLTNGYIYYFFFANSRNIFCESNKVIGVENVSIQIKNMCSFLLSCFS